jgi:hypothetical protein
MSMWNFCPNCGAHRGKNCGCDPRPFTIIQHSVIFLVLVKEDGKVLKRPVIEQRTSGAGWRLPSSCQKAGVTAEESLIQMLFQDHGFWVAPDQLQHFDQVDDRDSGVLRVCWTLSEPREELPYVAAKGDFLERKLQDPTDKSMSELELLWIRAYLLDLPPKKLRKDLQNSPTQRRRVDSSGSGCLRERTVCDVSPR